jgi:RNA polymerase sigma factor (sigma-70 family)
MDWTSLEMLATEVWGTSHCRRGKRACPPQVPFHCGSPLLKTATPRPPIRSGSGTIPPLVALARKKLRYARSAADEEDVVQNAFHSFFRAVGEGRYPHLDDRDSLWRLLVVITANKALKQITSEQRQKRGGSSTPGAAAAARIDLSDEADLADGKPTPEFAAQVADEYQRLLDQLGDDTLRQVAIWKMEGYGNDEIANKLGCSRRTVARKLEAIRVLWSQEPEV